MQWKVRRQQSYSAATIIYYTKYKKIIIMKDNIIDGMNIYFIIKDAGNLAPFKLAPLKSALFK